MNIKKEPDPTHSSNIEFQDDVFIIFFNYVRNNYKWILSFAFMGLLTAIIFLVFMPREYEALTQIKMAQTGSTVAGQALNVEDPVLLMARMSNPTVYTDLILSECSSSNNKQDGAMLVKKIKLTPIKGTDSVLEMRVKGPSRDVALNCVNSIFSMIETSQSVMVDSRLVEIKAMLAENYHLLDKIRLMDKSQGTDSAAYISTRDGINYILGQILNLKNIERTAESGRTRMIGAIYAAEGPVWPKKNIVLLIGLVFGIFVGAIFAQIYKMLNESTKLKRYLPNP